METEMAKDKKRSKKKKSSSVFSLVFLITLLIVGTVGFYYVFGGNPSSDQVPATSAVPAQAMPTVREHVLKAALAEPLESAEAPSVPAALAPKVKSGFKRASKPGVPKKAKVQQQTTPAPNMTLESGDLPQISVEDQVKAIKNLFLKKKQTETIDLLKDLFNVDINADVNGPIDDSGWSLLHHAASKRDLSVLKALYDFRLDYKARDNLGRTPFFLALDCSEQEENDRFFEVLDYLLVQSQAQKELVNIADDSGVTPLVYAINYNMIKTAQFLVDKGADVDAVVDGDNKNVLMLAAERGCPEIVEILLKAGVTDIDAQSTSNGWTALHWASVGCRDKTYEALLSNGADPTIFCKKFRTPYHQAAVADCASGIFDLGILPSSELNVPSNIETTDSEVFPGASVLHFAAAYDKRDAAYQLLATGSDQNVFDASGKTPLDYAVKFGHQKMVALLTNYSKRKDIYLEYDEKIANKSLQCSMSDNHIKNLERTKIEDERNLVLKKFPLYARRNWSERADI